MKTKKKPAAAGEQLELAATKKKRAPTKKKPRRYSPDKPDARDLARAKRIFRLVEGANGKLADAVTLLELHHVVRSGSPEATMLGDRLDACGRLLSYARRAYRGE